MLKAVLEGTYATVAHRTSTARVAYQPAKIIALTFDDGPGVYTPKILAILKAKGVKATFFAIGRQVPAYPSITRALASAGMSVQTTPGTTRTSPEQEPPQFGPKSPEPTTRSRP